MSQAKVAQELGISAPSVAQWEIGRSKPSLDRLPVLADLYGVSLEEICGTDLGTPDAVMRVVIDDAERSPRPISSDFSGDGPYSESEVAIIELWRTLSPDMRDRLLSLIEAISRDAA
ncbi:helix-turn-helix domain-containing protein [Acetobacter musti]